MGADLRADPELAKLAVEQTWAALAYCDPELRKDPDLALMSVKQSWQAYPDLPLELRKNGEHVQLAREAVRQNWQMLEHVPLELHDKDLVKTATKQDWKALAFARKDLRGQIDVINVGLKQTGLALQYASEEIRWDPKYVKRAMK